MNIIIIGSEGFIGSNLCKYFVGLEYNVYGADILEAPAVAKYTYVKVSRLSSEWEDVMQQINFDVCINAAGSGNVSYSVTHPLIDFEANTLDVIRILDSIKKHQISCKYLHISSAAVYGNSVSLPIKESSALQPISPYGYHKQMSEIVCKEYHHLFGIAVAIVRPFSIYGVGLKKQLLWDICNKLTVQKEVILFGTGDESRDFIHISDFVNVLKIIIDKSNFAGDIYNAASGIETTIKSIALIFESEYAKKIHFNGERKAGDPINWKADIEMIKEIGFLPKANLEISIRAYIKWFKLLHESN